MVAETPNLSLSAKREHLAKIHGRYQRAGRLHKSRILEEFCLNCGCHRKAALRLLNRPLHPPPRKRPGPKPRDQPAVRLPSLKALWLLSDPLCSKLLKAALPHWLEHYEPLASALPAAVRAQLLTLSPAQMDRLLQPVRVRHPRKGLCATKPGTLLRHQVPTRALPDENLPPRQRLGVPQLAALPAPDRTENESALHPQPGLSPERQRPLRVPTRRETHGRQLFGHDRFEPPERVALMNDLYRQEWSLLTHHFRPTFKRLKRGQRGSKTGRIYDPGPKTPGQRLLECPALPEATKQPLRAEHAQLNPIRLKKRLETKLRNFFTVLGNRDRESTKA